MSKQMDLQTFVKNSLVQVMEGCRLAQDELKESHSIICPIIESRFQRQGESAPGSLIGRTQGRRAIHTIDFNVAITATDEKETKGGIRVVAAIVGLETGGQSNSLAQQVSRIQFSIPVCYPEQGK